MSVFKHLPKMPVMGPATAGTLLKPTEGVTPGIIGLTGELYFSPEA